MSLPTSCGTSYYVFNPRAYCVPAAYIMSQKKKGRTDFLCPTEEESGVLMLLLSVITCVGGWGKRGCLGSGKGLGGTEKWGS
jgi:hypothetical protein